MMNYRRCIPPLLLGALFLAVVTLVSRAHAADVLFREDFASLENWALYYFPKIKAHSVYTIDRANEQHVLKAESNASASAIVYKKTFNVYDYPHVRWRWKVSNVYVKGDARTKAGDDYPLRVYILFEYDPAQAGAFEKMKYGLLKTIYGLYPPYSSLNYVWANKDEPERIVTSPYTVQAKMLLLEKGPAKAGTWQDEEVDIVKDYQKAFGINPPVHARVAIMNDSDNTGERSISYMSFMEIFR